MGEEDIYDPELMTDQISLENKELRNKNLELSGALTSGGFAESSENIIHERLETDKILERVEHFLKGDQIKIDANGTYYVEPTKNVLTKVKIDTKNKLTYFIQELKESKKGTEVIKEVVVRVENAEKEGIDILEIDSWKILDKLKDTKLKEGGYRYIQVLDENKKPLNEYGVSEFMRILSMYVTKETFLSCYDEERIYEILDDLSTEINKFLYCNYEKMGMDTKFKESKYSLIIVNIIHTVESCYRRALNGNEQKNLNLKAIITQGGGNYMGSSQQPIKKKWSPFKPASW